MNKMARRCLHEKVNKRKEWKKMKKIDDKILREIAEKIINRNFLIKSEEIFENRCPLMTKCEIINYLREKENNPRAISDTYFILCKDFKHCKRYVNRNNREYLKKEIEMLKNINCDPIEKGVEMNYIYNIK